MWVIDVSGEFIDDEDALFITTDDNGDPFSTFNSAANYAMFALDIAPSCIIYRF
jgi:hypothetical protein